MPYYRFHQNNSGGGFDHDPKAGIGYDVYVEARCPAEANQRAEDIGLYFDGCDKNIDCECCGGDRWTCAEPGDDESAAPLAAADDISARTDWRIFSYAHPLGGDFYKVAKI